MAHPSSASPRTRPCATRTDASQPPPAAGRAAQPWPPSLRSQGVAVPDAEDLLSAVAAGSGDRVLFIGEAGGELLCEALHRGCRGGAAFRAAPAHPDPVEVVVAPAIRTEEAGRAVADCARRALPAGGRLALLLLDPASARALARVGLFLGFAGLWCSLIHLLTARPVTPVPMLLMAAGMAVGFAVANRERPIEGSLNRWDEAVAFVGLAGLAHAVVRMTG